jgi:hypothetical protein
MGIFEECLEENPSIKKGSKVDALLQKLDKEDRDSLLNALLEPSIHHNRIISVLEKRGYQVGKEAIVNWRSLNLKKDS